MLSPKGKCKKNLSKQYPKLDGSFVNFVNSDYEETLTSEKHLIEFYQGFPTQNKVAFGHPKMKLVARYLEIFLPFSFVYFHRK